MSVGWSHYLIRLLGHIFGPLPKTLIESPIVFNETTQVFTVTGSWFNLPAVCIVLAITTLLVFGIKESARVNAAAVAIKLFVILLFIFACCGFVKKENYTPWVPERENGKYGVLGIFTGATMVFFAYIGFDAVSTAAQEAKNPQRDMPIGIIGSLTICTVLYIAVSAVLVGIAHYPTLNTAAPLADAIIDNLHWTWLAIIVEIGAIAGLTSVILISLMGQPRIFYAMAADGLFPKWVAKVHPKYHTPLRNDHHLRGRMRTGRWSGADRCAGGDDVNWNAVRICSGQYWCYYTPGETTKCSETVQGARWESWWILDPGYWCYSIGGANRNGHCSDHNSTIRLDGNWSCVLFCLWISAFPTGLGGETQGIETVVDTNGKCLSRLRIP